MISITEQFLTEYDYDFLYLLKCTLYEMRARANCGASMVAHSVIEELLLYLCSEESIAFIDIDRGCSKSDSEENIYAKEWVFDLLDSIDIITFLYSDVYLPPDHPYHFPHWNDQQFYI